VIKMDRDRSSPTIRRGRLKTGSDAQAADGRRAAEGVERLPLGGWHRTGAPSRSVADRGRAPTGGGADHRFANRPATRLKCGGVDAPGGTGWGGGLNAAGRRPQAGSYLLACVDKLLRVESGRARHKQCNKARGGPPCGR